MKTLLESLLFVVLVIISCNKKDENTDCVAVTITQSGTPCSNWGIKVGSNTYPSANIPTEFQQEGKTVCANYNLYQDMRLCACCGGTWANINSMKNFVR